MKNTSKFAIFLEQIFFVPHHFEQPVVVLVLRFLIPKNWQILNHISLRRHFCQAQTLATL